MISVQLAALEKIWSRQKEYPMNKLIGPFGFALVAMMLLMAATIVLVVQLSNSNATLAQSEAQVAALQVRVASLQTTTSELENKVYVLQAVGKVAVNEGRACLETYTPVGANFILNPRVIEKLLASPAGSVIMANDAIGVRVQDLYRFLSSDYRSAPTSTLTTIWFKRGEDARSLNLYTEVQIRQ